MGLLRRRQKDQEISQHEVISMLKAEGLTCGISSYGTVSAFLTIPMYTIVATPEQRKPNTYKRAEVVRFLSDYRMAKAGKPQYEGR